MKRLILLGVLILAIGCAQQEPAATQQEVDGMKITSSVFEEGKNIPSKFTCDGDDVSPPLAISEIPEGTMTLALISDDPDAPAGTWVHWVVWNIPATRTEFAEGQSPGKEGTTSFGRTGYGGPCPPSGTHRYFFKLYALDTKLDLEDSATKQDLEAAMEGHVLAQAQLMGTYKR